MSNFKYPIVKAFVAELLFAGRSPGTSVKSALGAFLGFVFGTGLKLTCCAVMLFYLVAYAF